MIDKIKKVKEEREEELLDLDGVQSVGIGKKETSGIEYDIDSIVVGVRKKKSEEELDDSQIVPKFLGNDKIHTDVVEIGEIQAPPPTKGLWEKIKEVLCEVFSFLWFCEHKNPDHKGRHRPIPIGVSCGHYKVTAGTESFLAVDEEGRTFSLGNNHVKSNSDRCEKGDPILQPGTADKGTVSEDRSGSLSGWVPIHNGMTVDIAWEEPEAEFINEILGIEGEIGEPRDPEVGDKILKSGRTTGVTKGRVKQVHATVKVRYPIGIVKLKDQVIASYMSQGGDSGSGAVIKADNELHPCAVLFAGSDRITVLNRISNVEKETGMKIKRTRSQEQCKCDENIL